jgi:hypothetical protein
MPWALLDAAGLLPLLLLLLLLLAPWELLCCRASGASSHCRHLLTSCSTCLSSAP